MTNRSPLLGSIAVLALLLLPCFARAQGFHAAITKDGTDVWAAGDGGRLWRSLDGGAAWAPRQLGGVPLRGVAHLGFVVLVVGDSGQVYRSTDNGGTFALQAIAGLPVLRAVAMPAADRAFVAGDAGTLLRSDDGGATWTPQSSGTTAALNALAFTDADHGWAAGDAGTLLRTVDGGGTWTPATSGTANALYAVAQSGSSVWLGGAEGTCRVSTDDGGLFAPLNLHTDDQPDVCAIALASATDAWVAGGGGFVRHTSDGGTSWKFPVSAIHGQVSALALGGGHLVAVSSRFLAPAAWDGAAAIALPAGATLTRSWVQRLTAGPATVRGHTVAVNPRNKHVVYALLGPNLYRSPDDGETWLLAQTLSGVNRANAFVISAKDSAVMVAAIVTSGGTRQLWRTTTAGASWSAVFTPANGWGEYGIPLEIHPDKPDTLLMGVDNSLLYRSTDGGATWNTFGTQVFRSPCDIIITPDNDAVVLVGDGITGSGIGDLWQSGDYGQTFAQRQLANGSEIPGMSMGRLNNKVAYATTWSAAGVRATPDGGKVWPLVADLNRGGQNVTASWGTAVGHDDANVVIVGQYSGGTTYLSTDGGTTFSTTTIAGSNYGLDIRDRETILAQQSGGMFKMRFNYAYTPATGTQTVQVTSPNGGESWRAGSVHAVTWNAVNVALARIEWRAGSADAWHPVADVEGYLGTFAWTLPDTETATAELRVSDAWDGSPLDAGNAVFAITRPRWSVDATALDLGTVELSLGGYGAFTIADPGSAPLGVTGVTSDNPHFTVFRTAFSVGPGAQDTLGVRFSPVAVGPDSALLTVTADDSGSPHVLAVHAQAQNTLDAGPPTGLPRAFALAQPSPNPLAGPGVALVRFDVPVGSRVRLEVYDVQGHRVTSLIDGTLAPGRYSVPFGGGRSGHPRAGVYFVRLRAPGFGATRRVMVLP